MCFLNFLVHVKDLGTINNKAGFSTPNCIMRYQLERSGSQEFSEHVTNLSHSLFFRKVEPSKVRSINGLHGLAMFETIRQASRKNSALVSSRTDFTVPIRDVLALEKMCNDIEIAGCFVVVKFSVFGHNSAP